MNLQNAQEAITKYRAKILEIVQDSTPRARRRADRSGQDGLCPARLCFVVDARIEALTSNATAVATTLIVRRPIPVTCPGRLGIVFGCRRAPRVSASTAPPQAGLCGRYAIHTRAASTALVAHRLSRGPRVELGRRLGGVRPVLKA